MSENEQPVPDSDPLMVEWSKWKKTDEYQSSVEWALRLRTKGFVSEFEIMLPLEQRRIYVEGSLWSAFTAGMKVGVKAGVEAGVAAGVAAAEAEIDASMARRGHMASGQQGEAD